MLYNGVNHFNWEANNFSDTYPGAAATTLTADGSNHTKGSDTAVLSGIAHDCWGMHIMISSGSTDSTARRQMIDLLIDPAAGVGNAGSSWSVLINNLVSTHSSAAAPVIGHQYYFPLFLPAGTAIGARVQDAVGGATCNFSLRVQGQPTRPDLLKVGHKVQTLGASTATTVGTAFTPGSAGVGTYSASLGTLTNDAWWWQVGLAINDSVLNGALVRIDVAADATSKYVCADSVFFGSNSNETSGKTWSGVGLPIRHIPAGSDVYVRGNSGTVAHDSNYSAVVYAVT